MHNIYSFESKNPQFQLQLLHARKAAQSSLPILITGPSGSGKDILAKAIHSISPRRQGPFVAVNCSTFNEGIIESELFGHLKGSFSGAHRDRNGAFETARGGTLFLDEIAELSPQLQAKLLRAIDNREIRPLGSDRVIQTDVRIIAATHHNLNMKMENGTFRADLFYRLNVIRIQVPSLKQRQEDFKTILDEICFEQQVRLTSEAQINLSMYHWPGNVRELKNSIARAAIQNPGEILTIEHFKDFIFIPHIKLKSENTVRQLPPIKSFEKELIYQTLYAFQGNQRRTARKLGMAKSTLFDKIRRYGIDVKAMKKEFTLSEQSF